MSPSEEVKSRLDIVDVINEYVPLKPAGTNWRARCPFHEEKSASFMVSKPKQIWHCFGCGEGGDVFTFVMKQEGIEFPEALKLLAEKAGVRVTFEPTEKRSERDRLLKVLENTAEFWGLVLDNWPTAEAARNYLLKERGLTLDTIKNWKIGFAPDSWDALTVHLKKQGFTDDDAVKAGIGVKKMESQGRSAYDRFRNRIMFPIADANGRVVGATGRIMPVVPGATTANAANEGKYVNTPETLLYHKGKVLFGLDKAKVEIRKQNLAVIVEGNMDAIASHQAGVANVIASSGTALTDDQVSLLRRFTERLAFAFDADAAGEAATLKGLAAALGAGFHVLLIELPKNAQGERYKDPDECVRDNPEAWKQAIAHAEPVLDHYLRRAGEEKDMSNLEHKQTVVRTLLPIIARLPDRVAETHYLGKLASLVQVSEQHLREALRKTIPSQPAIARPTSAPKNAPVTKEPLVAQSERLLASLFHDPKQTRFVISELPPEYLAPEAAALYREMIVYYTQGAHNGDLKWTDDPFREHLRALPNGQDALHYLDVLSLFAETEFIDNSRADFERDLFGQIKRLKKSHLRTVVQKLEQQIRNAERVGDDPARLRELLTEFQSISAEIVRLDSVD